MKLIHLTITLALAISATQAAPERKIVIPINRNPNYVPSIHNQLAKIQKKYKRDVPPNMGLVPLNDVKNDSEYVGTVYVGTPPKPFSINFDTGSSNFWIGTTSCQACTGQRLYDPQGSSSYSTNNQPWHIKYGDLTEASGIVFSDTVDIGGIQIKNLPMYAADKISQGDPSMDGLMGLGFDSGATVPGVKTPFEVMVENKLISSPIFGVYLGKTINQIQGTGEYIFGGYNRAHIGGDLTTVPVDTTDGYWGITMDNVKIGNTPFLSTPSRAIVDTGSSLIVFPKELALEVAKSYNAIDNNGTFIISCNENELPPLLIDIGGTEFTVPSDALIYSRETNGCTAGFTYSTDDLTVLGDVFMKNYYFIFNTAIPNIQIAPLK